MIWISCTHRMIECYRKMLKHSNKKKIKLLTEIIIMLLESQKESFLLERFLVVSINGFTFKGISRLELVLCLRSFKFYSSLSL